MMALSPLYNDEDFCHNLRSLDIGPVLHLGIHLHRFFSNPFVSSPFLPSFVPSEEISEEISEEFSFAAEDPVLKPDSAGMFFFDRDWSSPLPPNRAPLLKK